MIDKIKRNTTTGFQQSDRAYEYPTTPTLQKIPSSKQLQGTVQNEYALYKQQKYFHV